MEWGRVGAYKMVGLEWKGLNMGSGGPCDTYFWWYPQAGMGHYSVLAFLGGGRAAHATTRIPFISGNDE